MSLQCPLTRRRKTQYMELCNPGGGMSLSQSPVGSNVGGVIEESVHVEV